MSDLVKLGALWIKKDKRGRSYLTGRFSASTRLMIFKNEYKTNDSQPDYEMYLAPIEPAEGAPAPRQTDDFLHEPSPAPVRSNGAPSPRRDLAPAPEDEDETEDAPEVRRPQPTRAPAPAPSAPVRTTAKTASAPAPNARASRNAPAPPDDFDDMEDPFEN